MRTEDALRKIGLLRNVKTENGALEAEVENAARLAKALMERYAIRAEDIPAVSPRRAFRMTWIYWQELLGEFGFRLRRFGRRGNAAIGNDKIVYIKLGPVVDRAAVKRRLADPRSRLGCRVAARIPKRARKGLLLLPALTSGCLPLRDVRALAGSFPAARTHRLRAHHLYFCTFRVCNFRACAG